MYVKAEPGAPSYLHFALDSATCEQQFAPGAVCHPPCPQADGAQGAGCYWISRIVTSKVSVLPASG